MLNSPVGSILRKATRTPDEPLNIITFPTHERYESNLAKTGHNFYSFNAEGIKEWNETYAKLPENYRLLRNTLPLHVDFDIVLSQNKFGQFQHAKQIADVLHLPLVSLEHTLPAPNWTQQKREALKNMKGDYNVFISDYSVTEWQFDLAISTRVIKHCVDTDIFQNYDKERDSKLLSVVNDWINRDWCCGFTQWKQIVNKGDLPVMVVGDTEGLSKPAKDIDELVQAYNSSTIFLNTSVISPVPTALLEAMSCGCCPITTATCMIPEVIEHGVNGYMSNNMETLRGYCIELLGNPKKAKKMGEAARETILKLFNKERFLREWNELFREAAEVTYK